MTLSPLEIIQGTALLSLVVGIAVNLLTKTRYVSCRDCEQRHAQVDEKIREGERRDSKQFSMLKALITYSDDIPREEKAKLLNEGE